MLNKITQFFLPIVVTMSTIGCTATPPVTKANIPLVHSSLAYSLTPEKEVAINIPKANRYHNAQESFSIQFNGHEYASSKHYISATGNKCIRFSVQDEKSSSSAIQRKITTCQRDGQWRVIAPLVASEPTQSE